jgi:hypothetical protein
VKIECGEADVRAQIQDALGAMRRGKRVDAAEDVCQELAIHGV